MRLSDALNLRRIPYQKGKEGEIRVCCPFCASRGETQDTRYRLGINVRTQEGHCFNCGWRSRARAVTLYLRQLGIVDKVYAESQAEETSEPILRLPEDFTPLSTAERKDKLVARALTYLESRGVTPHQINTHKIGMSLVGRYAYRIVFPIFYQRKLKMLVGRDFTNVSKVRYLNSSGTEKVIFGLHKPTPCVVLSEGIFKALALENLLGSNGWGASGALLGHDLTALQLQQLLDLKVEEVTIWPDPDRVGLRGAEQIASALTEARFKVFIVPPAPAQADELSRSELTTYWGKRRAWNWAESIKIKSLATNF